MIGPNTTATPLVPKRCTANSTMITTMVAGMIQRSNEGATTCTPSMAESTEIAGVIMASP